MFSWLKNKNTFLPGQLGAALGGILMLGILFGGSSVHILQLHYAGERLRGELALLRRDPLFKKYPAHPAAAELLDTEALRGLAEEQGLEFVSSRSGENTLELAVRGGYANFLAFLQNLSLEHIGELSQIELNTNGQAPDGKIVIKQEVVK